MRLPQSTIAQAKVPGHVASSCAGLITCNTRCGSGGWSRAKAVPAAMATKITIDRRYHRSTSSFAFSRAHPSEQFRQPRARRCRVGRRLPAATRSAYDRTGSPFAIPFRCDAIPALQPPLLRRAQRGAGGFPRPERKSPAGAGPSFVSQRVRTRARLHHHAIPSLRLPSTGQGATSRNLRRVRWPALLSIWPRVYSQPR